MKSMERELQCPVCKEMVKQPILLPCQHSVCLLCASEVLVQSGYPAPDLPPEPKSPASTPNTRSPRQARRPAPKVDRIDRVLRPGTCVRGLGRERERERERDRETERERVRGKERVVACVKGRVCEIEEEKERVREKLTWQQREMEREWGCVFVCVKERELMCESERVRHRDSVCVRISFSRCPGLQIYFCTCQHIEYHSSKCRTSLFRWFIIVHDFSFFPFSCLFFIVCDTRCPQSSQLLCPSPFPPSVWDVPRPETQGGPPSPHAVPLPSVWEGGRAGGAGAGRMPSQPYPGAHRGEVLSAS